MRDWISFNKRFNFSITQQYNMHSCHDYLQSKVIRLKLDFSSGCNLKIKTPTKTLYLFLFLNPKTSVLVTIYEYEHSLSRLSTTTKISKRAISGNTCQQKIKIRKLPKILLENHKQRRTFHFKKLAAKMASKHFKSTVFISVLAGSCETFIYQVRRNSDQKNFSQIKEYRTKSLHVR